MIYRIVCDGVDIYGDTVETSVLKPHLDIELNSAGSLEFTLPKDNEDAWNMIKVFQNEIEVWENDEIIWFGRPLQITRDWNNQKKVVCEGALAYFNDTIERTNEIFPNAQHTNTIRSFFRHLIDSYNSQIEISSGGSIGEGKSFEVGEVDIPNVDVYRFTDYQTTFECLQQMCLDTNGGYFILRKVYNGPDSEHPYTRYIDWYETMPYGSTQDVEFGINLLDLTNDINGSDICTVLIPTGEDNLKLNTLGNKNPDSDVNRGVGHKSGSDEIWYEPGVQVYGRVVNQHSFNDYSSVDALWAKARDWLVNKNTDIPTIEVDAADLHYIKEYSEVKGNFKVGMNVQVTSGPHDMNQSLVIYKLSMDLDTGTKKVTLGTPPKKELTDIVAPSSGRKTTRGKGGDKPGDEVVKIVEDIVPIRVKQPGSDHYSSAVSNGVAYIDLTNTGGGDVHDVTVDGESIVDPDTKVANLDSSDFGTTVVANPSGTTTDDLTKVQIGDTVYDIPGGGGGGGERFRQELIYDTPVSTAGNITVSDFSDADSLTFVLGLVGDGIYQTFINEVPMSELKTGELIFIGGTLTDSNGHAWSKYAAIKYINDTTINLFDVNGHYWSQAGYIYRIYKNIYAASVIHHPVAMDSYYDTEEQEIGRWTDGKPLYQKTIVIGTPSYNTYASYSHGISDFGELVGSYGSCINNGTNQLAIPLPNQNTQYSIFLGNINSTDIHYQFGSGFNNISDFSVTLQYTKITDAPGTGVPKTKLISRSDIYSENERIIGRWTDGKPLYQKTWNINLSAPSANTWYSTGILLSDYDVDTIVDGVVNDVYNQYISCTVGTKDDYIGVNTYVSNRTLTKITVRYTKTTDAPGSGVLPEDPQLVYLSDYYSEEERVVGRWTDGKPLYQKSVTFTGNYVNSGDISIDISNIDQMVDIEAIGYDGGDCWMMLSQAHQNTSYGRGFFYNKTTNKMEYRFGSNIVKIYSTLKYTKTTDLPNSGPTPGNLIYLPTIYSEEERQVGVWTDGKPLYQKTIYAEHLYTSNSGVNTIEADSSYIDTLVDAYGSGYCAKHSQVTTIGNSHRTSQSYSSRILLNTGGSVPVLQVEVGADYQLDDAYITIQYTKTTDTPGSGIWTPDGNLSHHYSTTEHIIGTWIDGSTLWERTWDLGSDVSLAQNTWVDTSISNSNLSMITHSECLSSSGTHRGQVEADVNSTGSYVQLRSDGINATVRYITLRYTKSS